MQYGLIFVQIKMIIVCTVDVFFYVDLYHPLPVSFCCFGFDTYYSLDCDPLLGGSGGVVNSLNCCPASLKSLGCFYFRCVLSSQRKRLTANL